MGSLKKFKDSISFSKQVGILNKKDMSTGTGSQLSKTNLTKAVDKFLSDPKIDKLPSNKLQGLGEALDKLEKKKFINKLPAETVGDPTI